MENKALIICGPTATGKTALALQIAKEFNGELVSADSRQVYIGKDIITGKDIPQNFHKEISDVKWRNKLLTYYTDGFTRIWLLDIVSPNEEFNVSFWKECADLVITDISQRGKLPIVVGGTGLYIKSLAQNLSQITIPPNPNLRKKLESKDINRMFNYLNKIDPAKATSLNISDKNNPRRLVRAIEISLSKSTINHQQANYELLQIALTAPKEFLYQRVDQRVIDRIAAAAAAEDPDLAANPQKWQEQEHEIIRHQLTWFKKQPGIIWFDITQSSWQNDIINLVSKYATQNRNIS